MTVSEKLLSNAWDIDRRPHIRITKPEACESCKSKPCVKACPAECYRVLGNRVMLSTENCLECGACRFVCPFNAIEWNYPRGGFGVVYRYG